VTFVGRLGTYRYYNMDQVVGQALALFNRIAESEKREAGMARAAREMVEVNGAAGSKVALGTGD
jgi:UDP-galactopyranose mutase